MVAYPYTKLLCANNHVDQAAALLICSVEKARSFGVSPDRFVFPHSGAEADDTPFVSERIDLVSSPALRLAGREVFRLAGTGPADVELVDLYSCFPSAVQVAAAELGIGVDRALTVTGGLTFAGGPGNNFATHALATLASGLRRAPETFGLCTANGGLLTKHAMGIYSTVPPANPFRLAHLSAEVEAAGHRELSVGYEGPATLEAFTVLHDRDGQPERAFATARLPDGSRSWARSSDQDVLRQLMTDDPVPLQITLSVSSDLSTRLAI
jgi:acetyl-CoA C-acetyltransferase